MSRDLQARRVTNLTDLLTEAHEHVCGALCPKVWQTDNPPAHSELCQNITRARGLHRSPFPPHPKAA